MQLVSGNLIARVLGVGVLGAPFLGYIQNTRIDAQLQQQDSQLHARVIAPEKRDWVLGWAVGKYRTIDSQRLADQSKSEQQTINELQDSVSQKALATVAIFPVIMLICYLGLILYFNARGGYRAEELPFHERQDE